MPTGGSYIKRRAGRNGLYFQRSVPPDVRDVIGCATWTRKAGSTAAEAKRNAAIYLEETEQLIRQARGQRLPVEQQIQSLLEKDIRDLSSQEILDSVAPRVGPYLDDGTVNPRYEELHQAVQDRLQGHVTELRTPEDLLERARLLKRPAASTYFEWERYLGKVMEMTGKDFITQISREDALAFRAEELSRCQPSTVRTRLRFLNGLFNVAQEEGWINTNPFDQLTKRVKGRRKQKEVVRLDEADKNWRNLPSHHQLLWHLLRWTGSHVGEAAGLRWKDIDLVEGVIRFEAHTLRPLKNDFRIRTIPIHEALAPILNEETFGNPNDLIFPWAFNEKRGRWGEGMHWSQIIGVSPKATRDWAATCLRSKDINESVIGRLFGHTPKTQTAVYGAVTLETMRKALAQLD